MIPTAWTHPFGQALYFRVALNLARYLLLRHRHRSMLWTIPKARQAHRDLRHPARLRLAPSHCNRREERSGEHPPSHSHHKRGDINGNGQHRLYIGLGQKVVLRLCECFKKSQEEVVSNSINKN